MLKGTSNAKSELTVIEMGHSFVSTLGAFRYETCQHFYLAMYGAMNYSLLIPNFVAFYAKTE